MGWILVDDFGDDTAGSATCDLLGTIKQPGDFGVFRGRLIEAEGYMDLSQQAIEDAAMMIGWQPPAKFERAEQKQAIAEAEAKELREKLRIAEGLKDLLDEAIERFPRATPRRKPAAKKAS